MCVSYISGKNNSELVAYIMDSVLPDQRPGISFKIGAKAISVWGH